MTRRHAKITTPDTALPDALSSMALFWQPDRRSDSSSIFRVPFMFWLADVLRPRRIVQVGLGSGDGYFALCQAAERFGGTTQCIGCDPALEDAVVEHNARRYAGFSRLINGTTEDLGRKIGTGTVDLLVIEAARDLQRIVTDAAALLSGRSAVLIVGTTDVMPWNEGPVVRLTLGEEDLALLTKTSAGDGRLASLVATEDNTPERLQLVSVFNRLGSALKHEERGIMAQDLAERLAVSQAEYAQLAAAYDERQKTLSRMQAMLFDQTAQHRSTNGTSTDIDAQLALRFEELGALTRLLEQERARRMAAEGRINALTGSTSWRVTGPLRGASQALRKVLGRA